MGKRMASSSRPMIERYASYLVEAKEKFNMSEDQLKSMQKRKASPSLEEEKTKQTDKLREHFRQFSIDERSTMQAAQHLILAQQLGKLERFCEVCYMTTDASAQKSHCFCEKIRDSESLRKLCTFANIKIIVYMHYKELSQMRVSNLYRKN
jgi:hypothetical protein